MTLTSGIELIQVYLDNNLVANLTEPAPIPLRNVTPGEHMIKAIVKDKAGNMVSTHVIVRIAVQTTAVSSTTTVTTPTVTTAKLLLLRLLVPC